MSEDQVPSAETLMGLCWYKSDYSECADHCVPESMRQHFQHGGIAFSLPQPGRTEFEHSHRPSHFEL